MSNLHFVSVFNLFWNFLNKQLNSGNIEKLTWGLTYFDQFMYDMQDLTKRIRPLHNHDYKLSLIFCVLFVNFMITVHIKFAENRDRNKNDTIQ